MVLYNHSQEHYAPIYILLFICWTNINQEFSLLILSSFCKGFPYITLLTPFLIFTNHSMYGTHINLIPQKVSVRENVQIIFLLF